MGADYNLEEGHFGMFLLVIDNAISCFRAELRGQIFEWKNVFSRPFFLIIAMYLNTKFISAPYLVYRYKTDLK